MNTCLLAGDYLVTDLWELAKDVSDLFNLDNPLFWFLDFVDDPFYYVWFKKREFQIVYIDLKGCLENTLFIFGTLLFMVHNLYLRLRYRGLYINGARQDSFARGIRNFVRYLAQIHIL
jgi:hypothetical protein